MKETQSETEFFDYEAVPNDYKKIITVSIALIKEKLPTELAKNLCKLLTQEKRLTVIIENFNQFTLDTKIKQDLKPVILTLHKCINGDLETICETYDIDQGHLAYDETNHVFEVVHDDAINAIGEVADIT